LLLDFHRGQFRLRGQLVANSRHGPHPPQRTMKFENLHFHPELIAGDSSGTAVHFWEIKCDHALQKSVYFEIVERLAAVEPKSDGAGAPAR
jgi:hypothetical protein